jgi:hypothetical protein
MLRLMFLIGAGIIALGDSVLDAEAIRAKKFNPTD